MIRINDLELNIDVKAELENYEWEKAIWKENKLIACSPFRGEEHPSFYCFFNNGVWGDSGSDKYHKGNFVQLLSFLRNETEEETVDYLVEKYNEVGSSIQLNRIRLRDTHRKRKQEIDKEILSSLIFDPRYLKGRGIEENIQRYFQINVTKDYKAVAIPWFLPDGKLGNIKYRLIESKRFWYEKGGYPVKDLLYGIHLFHVRPDLKTVVITESEIDSLSCIQVGFPSLAVGGSSWSKEKTNLILNTNIEELIIATDNDNAGEKLKNQIVKSLSGRYHIRIANIPNEYKDCNGLLQADPNLLKSVIDGSSPVKRFNLLT